MLNNIMSIYKTEIFNNYFNEKISSEGPFALNSYFCSFLDKNSKILDMSYGYKDTIYFLDRGFIVTNYELDLLGKRTDSQYVKNQKLKKIQNCTNVMYNGLWLGKSCSNWNNMDIEKHLDRYLKMIKNGGIIFGSFRYGNYKSYSSVKKQFRTHFVPEELSYILECRDISMYDIFITTEKNSNVIDLRTNFIMVK